MSEVKVYAGDKLRLRPDVPGAKMWAVGMEKAMLTYFELSRIHYSESTPMRQSR